MTRPNAASTPDLSKAHDLTVGAISRLECPFGKQQAFLRDKKSPSLRVRVTANGAKSFVFEAKLHGKTIRKTIGDIRTWTIESAREQANRLRVTLDMGVDPRELERQQKANQADLETKRMRNSVFTLEKLLDTYCEYLEKLERRSHRDARSIFKLHILEAWPEMTRQPANEVTGENIADMMRRLLELDKGRTANKLRSYVGAAYQTAKTAKTKPSIPLIFKEFDIKSNPVADTAPDESQNKPDKKPLSKNELKHYWQCIKNLDGQTGALLRLHLLSGAPRIEQLVRLKNVDIHPDHYILFDNKGRSGKSSRPHVLPLTSQTVQDLKALTTSGIYALSTDNGKTHIAATTLSKWATQAAKSIANFQAKRIRSGVETLLASAKISPDIRGRLQSHGISGVQARHYDGYDYMDEKRHAQTVLFNLLELNEHSNIVPFKQLHTGT